MRMANARAPMLECHHALIMHVVLCGRCRRDGAEPGRCTTPTAIFVLQVTPEPFIPRAHMCVGPHPSMRLCSAIGVNHCYESRVGETSACYINEPSEATVHILGI